MVEIRLVLKHALIPIHNSLAIINNYEPKQNMYKDAIRTINMVFGKDSHRRRKKPFMAHLNLKLKAIFLLLNFHFSSFQMSK